MKWLLVLFVFSSLSLAAEKEIKAPGIDGLKVGMRKTEALALVKTSALFKDCKNVLDSNVFIIASKKGKFIVYEDMNISSIKCMFDKKKTIQAMSIVFPAYTVDDIENIFTFAIKTLGPAKTTSSKKIGFMFEAEWKIGKYSATFFASNQGFEAYLLVAYSKFVKKEEKRGAGFLQ